MHTCTDTIIRGTALILTSTVAVYYLFSYFTLEVELNHLQYNRHSLHKLM